jgi:hypothetical protein
MKATIRFAGLLGAMAAIGAVAPAQATEGALGRPITGLQGTSFAGVVPPTPGWNMGISYAYYAGDVGAERETPLTGGGTALGLGVTAQLFSITGIYVWDTGEGRWNYASVAVLPFAKIDAEVNVRIGAISASTSDSKTGLFDMIFVPVIASRHFSQTKHMSLALYIFAPTGSFDPDRLANVSLNNWTFSPTVGYTQLFGKGTVEFSTLAAVDFYTENDATNYQNGAVFRVDSLLVKRFQNGWGIGGAGGWIEQLEDDTGPTADRLNGFKGRSFALGPIATYAKKWEGGQVEFSARWLHEFGVERRFEGNPILVSATITF